MNKLSLKDLVNECLTLGLKTYGTKAILIKRITDEKKKLADNDKENDNDKEKFLEPDSEDELEDVEIQKDSESTNDLKTTNDIDYSVSSASDSESCFSEESNITDRKRKRTQIIYALLNKFDDQKSAVAFINLDKETEWKFERTRKTAEGFKEVYQCKHRNLCKKKCYLLYSEEDESVTLWLNNQTHTHENVKTKQWGINDVTKFEIEKLYKSGVCHASRVQYALRDMMNKDSITYVEGIEEPTRRQINNFINNNIKCKIIKPNFSYGDLAKYVSEHRDVPEDEHEPFVIDAFIDVNDKMPKASLIRIAISTKYLLKLAMKRNHVCTDATYKLIWQGIQ